MKLAIGSDHAGYDLKEIIKNQLSKLDYQIEDVGCFNKTAVDYPDYASAVAGLVSQGSVEQGILICNTGVGMSIMANKYPKVRTALCTSAHMAKMARAHNNANVLALGAELTPPEQASEIVKEWLATEFSGADRHRRRVNKIRAYTSSIADPVAIYDTDPELYAALTNEARRQREHLELIASENYVSPAVREAVGSWLTNKYAEGYPGKRWYDGCEFVDEAERIAIERAKNIFGAEHANVQPHCGSSANMAVLLAALQPGDTVLAMDLSHGGHLTHGLKSNFSGRLYKFAHYGVNQATEQIDMTEVAALAQKHKPRMIIAGASAYSRIIDFEAFREVADSVGALLLVDMAHIAGLVAAGCHTSPVPHADFVTSTTHKTLRGPRSGLILCRRNFAQDIDRMVFPGLQGGPLMHVIAAKAVCFAEAMKPEFKIYQEQVVRNAKHMAEALKAEGLRIISGGTDNHLMLVDVTPLGITGKDAATALNAAGITVNKNTIPFDAHGPAITSGIRIGTPALTTRGMKEQEMARIAQWMGTALKNTDNEATLTGIRAEVIKFTADFPVP